MDFTINSLQLCPQLGVCSAAQPSGEATIPDRHPVTVPQFMYVYVYACCMRLFVYILLATHRRTLSLAAHPSSPKLPMYTLSFLSPVGCFVNCLFLPTCLLTWMCVFAYLPSNQSTAVLPTTGWNLKLQKWKKRAMSENRIAKLWQRILSFWQCACNTNNNEWRPSDFASLNGVNGFSVNIVTQLTGCQLQAASS